MNLVPSLAGYFPLAKWHYFARPEGSTQLILILCVRGEGWLQLSRGEYRVRPGNLIILQPNEPHSYGAKAHRPWSIYWCHATGPGAWEFGKHLLAQNACPIWQVTDYPRLVTVFTQMLGELEQGYGLDHLLPASATLAHLLGLVYTMGRLQRDGGMESTLRIRQVAEYLQQLPSKDVSVNALAEMANLSVSHFSALFKRVTGFAPIDYLLHSKVQRACRILDTTKQPIKVVAGQVGFADPLYFSRVFRRVYGTSPTVYRNTAKG